MVTIRIVRTSWPTRSVLACLFLNYCILQMRYLGDEHHRSQLGQSVVSQTIEKQEVQEDSLLTAIKHVARILLPSNLVENYLMEHNVNNFRFYVYDDLPDEFSWQNHSLCLKQKNPGLCDWGESVCGEESKKTTEYGKKRLNRNGDGVLSHIFLTYNGSMRVFDPTRADIFIVPYASQAHCACRGSPQIKNKRLKHLLGQLRFFNETTKHRHLLLSSSSIRRGILLHNPLMATIGPIEHECPKNRSIPCGHIVMPYVNTNPEYQPPIIMNDPLVKSRIHRKREFSVAARMSDKISGNPTVRLDFIRTMRNISTLGGLPVNVAPAGEWNREFSLERATMELYRNSVFCPALRGDTPSQKRFFDAILSGCIPVVLKYESNVDGFASYFTQKATAVPHAFPYAQGSFYGIPEMGLNYSEILVEIAGLECGVPCIAPTLKRLLREDPETIKQIQLRMSQIAPLFSFGLGENRHRYPDSVAAILLQAKHFVDSYRSFRQ